MMEDMENKLAFLLASSPHFMLKGGSSTYGKAAKDFIANGVVVREKGEWMERYNEGYEMWFYDCPFCGDGYSMKQRDKSKPNFCPNCGADMIKGETDGL